MATDRVWWYDAMGCEETNEQCLTQWNIVHIAAIIPATLSSIASIFIIITGIVYHRKFSNLTFAAQLPIFLSICDLSFEICHGGDHLHNVIHGYVSEAALCQFFGCMKPFWINCQTAWAFGVSLYLYRCIFSENQRGAITFGKHNIYLHLFCWGLPIIILIIGFAADVYGVEGPWCGIPDNLADLLMVDMWIAVCIVALIVIYGLVICKLRRAIKRRRQSIDDCEANRETQKRTKKAIRMIGLYPIAYVFQWIAYALLKTHVIKPSFDVLVWVVLTANLGGVFNLFLYGPLMLNQIKRERKKQMKIRTEMTRAASHTNTITNDTTSISPATSTKSLTEV